MAPEPENPLPEKDHFPFLCATICSLLFVFLNVFAVFLFPLFVLGASLVLFFSIVAWIRSPIYYRAFLVLYVLVVVVILAWDYYSIRNIGP